MADGAASLSVSFLFFAIFLGAFLSYLLSRFTKSLPYTVTIFFVGVAITYITEGTSKAGSQDSLAPSIIQWEHIDANLFLYAFLPVLLFSEAMTLNIHQLKSSFFPAALLAGPGAAFGAYMLALVCYYLIPYKWDWFLCFLFGSILCSTDPVR